MEFLGNKTAAVKSPFGVIASGFTPVRLKRDITIDDFELENVVRTDSLATDAAGRPIAPAIDANP